MTDGLSLLLAAVAIVLQVLVVGVAVLAVAAPLAAPARRALGALRDTLSGTELWLAFAIALVATLGSLYYSEVADFVPCRLCWFQRIAMYPLVVILLVAAVRRDFRAGPLYALAFPVAGALVSAYHIYIERNPDAESKSCKAGVPCSTKWIEEFGYVTLPTLAISAFAAIFVLLVFARARAGRARRAGRAG